jgi:hypothetical protein
LTEDRELHRRHLHVVQSKETMYRWKSQLQHKWKVQGEGKFKITEQLVIDTDG